MSALPDGTYEGIILSSKPSPKHKIHVLTIRLLTGEHIEPMMYGGRSGAVVLARAALKFVGIGQPWLANPDRAVPLPVLKITLAFDEKYPERNRVVSVAKTGENMLCDVREAVLRTDWTGF